MPVRMARLFARNAALVRERIGYSELMASAAEASSVQLRILADILGLALIALQFTVLFLWLVRDDGTRLILGIVAYGILVAVALGMWHGKEASESLSTAYDWEKSFSAQSYWDV